MKLFDEAVKQKLSIMENSALLFRGIVVGIRFTPFVRLYDNASKLMLRDFS